MAGLISLLVTGAGLAVVCCGLAAVLRRRWRLGLRLFVAGNGTTAAGAVIGGSRPLAAVNAAVACAAAFALWWFRRRGERAPRFYGAKSWARVTALARKAREAARPRPVRRPAPQGG